MASTVVFDTDTIRIFVFYLLIYIFSFGLSVLILQSILFKGRRRKLVVGAATRKRSLSVRDEDDNSNSSSDTERSISNNNSEEVVLKNRGKRKTIGSLEELTRKRFANSPPNSSSNCSVSCSSSSSSISGSTPTSKTTEPPPQAKSNRSNLFISSLLSRSRRKDDNNSNKVVVYESVDQSAGLSNFSRFIFYFSGTFVLVSWISLFMALFLCNVNNNDEFITFTNSTTTTNINTAANVFLNSSVLSPWWLTPHKVLVYCWFSASLGCDLALFVLIPVAFFYDDDDVILVVDHDPTTDHIGDNDNELEESSSTLLRKRSERRGVSGSSISKKKGGALPFSGRYFARRLVHSLYYWVILVILLALLITVLSNWIFPPNANNIESNSDNVDGENNTGEFSLFGSGSLLFIRLFKNAALIMYVLVGLARVYLLPRGMIDLFRGSKVWAVSLRKLKECKQKLEQLFWDQQALEAKLERFQLERRPAAASSGEHQIPFVDSDFLRRRRSSLPIPRQKQTTNSLLQMHNVNIGEESSTSAAASTEERSLRHKLSKIMRLKKRYKARIDSLGSPILNNLIFVILLLGHALLVLLLGLHLSAGIFMQLIPGMTDSIFYLYKQFVPVASLSLLLPSPPALMGMLVKGENILLVAYHHFTILMGLYCKYGPTNLSSNEDDDDLDFENEDQGNDVKESKPHNNGNNNNKSGGGMVRGSPALKIFGWFMGLLLVSKMLNWLAIDHLALSPGNPFIQRNSTYFSFYMDLRVPPLIHVVLSVSLLLSLTYRILYWLPEFLINLFLKDLLL